MFGKGACILFNPHCDPVYDVSDKLYDVRYNVYDVCGKTCAETDNVYDVRDKTSEKGVPAFREGVLTCREGDFVGFDCCPGSGAPIQALKSTVFWGGCCELIFFNSTVSIVNTKGKPW